ncbi:hypothetical protein [Providencia huaxiensis]|uniref:hypothetical protein n=1 Tax=Providencia huaxiensis TaxID=2027290 RepID=UPI000C7F4F4E|nr:hypothetical protein [Providencia huaxiensis]AXH60544.1 hypothetical protein CYG50_00140 [Providencia huaxiensis]
MNTNIFILNPTQTIVSNLLFNESKKFKFFFKSFNVNKEIINIETLPILIENTNELLNKIRDYEMNGYFGIKAVEV